MCSRTHEEFWLDGSGEEDDGGFIYPPLSLSLYTVIGSKTPLAKIKPMTVHLDTAALPRPCYLLYTLTILKSIWPASIVVVRTNKDPTRNVAPTTSQQFYCTISAVMRFDKIGQAELTAKEIQNTIFSYLIIYSQYHWLQC
jgi:hypothetical protein